MSRQRRSLGAFGSASTSEVVQRGSPAYSTARALDMGLSAVEVLGRLVGARTNRVRWDLVPALRINWKTNAQLYPCI